MPTTQALPNQFYPLLAHHSAKFPLQHFTDTVKWLSGTKFCENRTIFRKSPYSTEKSTGDPSSAK